MNEKQLWDSYLRKKDEASKHALASHYFRDVEAIAKNYQRNRYGMRHRDVGELVSYGVEGLYRAIGSYDPSLGVKFFSFAQKRIEGAIKDGLRNEAPLGFRRVDQRPENHRMRGKAIYSIDSLPEDESAFWREPVATCTDVSARAQFADLVSWVNHYLDKRETRLVRLYVIDGLTMEQTAQRMKISESRVSQLFKLIVAKLKAEPDVLRILEGRRKEWKQARGKQEE